MKFLLLIVTVINISCASLVASELVELTNYSGKSIACSILRADSEEVKIKVKGKVYVLPLDSLDLASRDKVKAWIDSGAGLSKKLALRVQSGKTERVSKREGYDDRDLRLKPFATILNDDRKLPTSELNATFILIGKPVLDGSLYYVFSRDYRNLGAIKEGGQVKVNFSPVSAEFDDRGYAQYGHKYAGYAMVVRDKNDAVVAAKSVPSNLIKEGVEAILKMRQGQYYTKNLTRVTGVDY
ncbi:hypothetical protein [Rubritalea marina]|uniref:hypothetical protein n=1 Tax=Rubritalea marina TaxID=361055 RepID=UPI00035E9806|nr:hypothetical protein [Rubritalea marina]